MLGFRRDTDDSALHAGLRLGQVDHFLQRGHFELAVVGHIGRANGRNAFACAQGLEFGQGEVLHKPAGDGRAIDGLGGLAGGKLGAVHHIGGGLAHAAVGVEDGNRVLVACHQHPVFGDDQVGFNDVGAVVNRLLVRSQRVFGPQRRGPAVGNHGGGGRPGRCVAAAAGRGHHHRGRHGQQYFSNLHTLLLVL